MTKMRILMPFALGALIVAQGCTSGGAGAGTAEQTVELLTEHDKTLYALGMTTGGSLSSFALKPEELKVLNSGLLDAVNGVESRVDLEIYGPKIRDLARARTALSARTEKDRSQAFLGEAAAEEGATRTDSGLVYFEIKKGDGPSPRPEQSVKVHYRGTLTDGTEFDSSYKRGRPAEFPLNGVIPCWTEGLQRMAVGGEARLICPSDIAYGDSGRPPVIPPGATLIFEIELIEIVGQ